MMSIVAWMTLLQETPKQDVEPGYDGGFFIETKDLKFTVEGLLQVNGVFFEPGAAHESEFVLRRMRLEFSGDFFDRFMFHIEPKFASDGVELEEAWIGFRIGEHRFLFGRMKEPFSLEEMASLRHMDMINFSILNQFVPAEDHGITILGRFDWLEYGVGFYNGTGGDDTTSDKDVAARLVVHPWRGLQFGGSVTFGREEIDLSGEELKTEARVPWAKFVAGTKMDGDRLRLGAEAAFLEGPFAITAEFIAVRQDLNDVSVDLIGGYVQTSWVITGEEKTWKGVNPDRPFLREPGVGAWQVVARWSRLDLDGDLAPFLTNFPDVIDTFTIGVNWYANQHAKLKINALRTLYREEITMDGVSHDKEDAVLIQAQIMF